MVYEYRYLHCLPVGLRVQVSASCLPVVPVFDGLLVPLPQLDHLLLGLVDHQVQLGDVHLLLLALLAHALLDRLLLGNLFPEAVSQLDARPVSETVLLELSVTNVHHDLRDNLQTDKHHTLDLNISIISVSKMYLKYTWFDLIAFTCI